MPPLTKRRVHPRLVVFATVVGACAAPSRRLTPRVVEDPITLPRGMAAARIGGGVAHYRPSHTYDFPLNVALWYGITDRLEWTNPLSLRCALLDDRPADGRRPRPMSLARS